MRRPSGGRTPRWTSSSASAAHSSTTSSGPGCAITIPSARIVGGTSGTTCCKSTSAPPETGRSAGGASLAASSHPTPATRRECLLPQPSAGRASRITQKLPWRGDRMSFPATAPCRRDHWNGRPASRRRRPCRTPHRNRPEGMPPPCRTSAGRTMRRARSGSGRSFRPPTPRPTASCAGSR